MSEEQENQPISAESFDQETYLKKRRSQKRRAWLAAIAGGAILLNGGTPVPIPLIGMPAIFIGTALVLFAFLQFKAAAQPPIVEAIQIARDKYGQVTRSELLLQLQLDPQSTDALIEFLIQQGFLEVIDSNLAPETETRYRLIS